MENSDFSKPPPPPPPRQGAPMPRVLVVLLVFCALFFVVGGSVFLYTSYRAQRQMDRLMRDIQGTGGAGQGASD